MRPRDRSRSLPVPTSTAAAPRYSGLDPFTEKLFARRRLLVRLLAIFGICVGLSFVVWGIIAAQYLWPALRPLPRSHALRLLLLVHSFRFIGLAFVVPGVVSPDLPPGFARPAAYGDLIAAVLVLVALAGLGSRFGLGLVWSFNLGGGCGSALRLLSGSDRCRDQAGPIGGRLFHPDRCGATALCYARPGIPALNARRR